MTGKGLTQSTGSIPMFTAGSSSITGLQGSSSGRIVFNTSGNVGIGTINPSYNGLTINSNGSVTMGNPNPNQKLNIYDQKVEDLRIRLFSLLVESIKDGANLGGAEMNKIHRLFDDITGYNSDIEEDFGKFYIAIEGKGISRKIRSGLFDVLEEKVRTGWGFTLDEIPDLFEKI